MNQIRVLIKESTRNHPQKIDEVIGSPEKCAAHIISKYGGKSILSMPAHEFLKLQIGEDMKL